MPSITILTACMGREENLVAALSTWTELSVEEIIIIDYNYRPTVYQYLKENHISDCRINVIHANKYSIPWTLSWAYNIGFRYCTGDLILKLDTDDCIVPGNMQPFLDYVRRASQKTVLWTGDWSLEHQIKDATSSGVFLADRSSIYKCGGFNHCILTYGWDDIDLYTRISKLIGCRYLFPSSTTMKVAHSKLDRYSNQLNATSDQLATIINAGVRDISCTLNMMLCKHLDSQGFKLPELTYSNNPSDIYSMTQAMKISATSALSSISFIEIVEQICASKEKRKVAKKLLSMSYYKEILRSLSRNTIDEFHQ